MNYTGRSALGVVDESIRRICSSDALVEAKDVMRLAMWIRFSFDDTIYRTACLQAACLYTERKYGELDFFLDQNQELHNATYDLLSTRLLNNLAFDLIDTTPYEVEQGGDLIVSDYSLVADAVHFLLWYRPASRAQYDKPSLAKAFYFISEIIKTKSRPKSWPTFLKLWSKHQNAAALIYAAEYCVEETWLLDPYDDSLVSRIAILQREGAARRLLAVARAVEKELDLVLDPRTRAKMERAYIPPLVEEVPLEPVNFDANVYKKMKAYRAQ